VDVDERHGIGRDELAATWVREGRAVVLRGAAAGWPALGTWTPERLRALGADLEVHVEVGNAVQGANPRRRTTLGGYLDDLASGRAEAEQLYLAVFDLFGRFPELLADVDLSLLTGQVVRYRRGWIGARGTVSGFHRDIGDNVLAQVRGRKLVKLVAPADDDRMYLSRKYDFLTECSDVDVDHWDAARHPAFADADVGDVVLAPGDVLFIPTGWWHYTRALDTSISVNSGGATPRELLGAAPHLVKDVLHRLHLYRRGWCACHQPIVDAEPLDAPAVGAR
jgi:lysine-specific demethylase 8